MTELIRPEELPRWVPGKLLLAGDETGWRDVVLRSYDYEARWRRPSSPLSLPATRRPQSTVRLLSFDVRKAWKDAPWWIVIPRGDK
jgi:hypothetical protein